MVCHGGSVLPAIGGLGVWLRSGVLGAHAGELRVWARDAGVTLPGPESDALAGESGTSSYGI